MKKILTDANNFDGRKTATPRGSEVLVLTLLRTSQQKIRRNYKRKERFFQSLDKPPRFCKANKIAFVTKIGGQTKLVNFASLPCKQWACPDCQKRKVISLRYRLIEVIKANDLDHWLTLTLNPKNIPAKYLQYGNKTGRYITHLFNHFLVCLKRKMKRKIKYVWIKEFQDNGNAHLHVILGCFLPIKLVRSLWRRIGGGHIMDIQRINNLEATAVYVTKYLIKGLVKSSKNSGFLVGERRFTISSSCVKPVTNITYKPISITDLKKELSPRDFFKVYNVLENSDDITDEIVLAPFQQSLGI